MKPLFVSQTLAFEKRLDHLNSITIMKIIIIPTIKSIISNWFCSKRNNNSDLVLFIFVDKSYSKYWNWQNWQKQNVMWRHFSILCWRTVFIHLLTRYLLWVYSIFVWMISYSIFVWMMGVSAGCFSSIFVVCLNYRLFHLCLNDGSERGVFFFSKTASHRPKVPVD